MSGVGIRPRSSVGALGGAVSFECAGYSRYRLTSKCTLCTMNGRGSAKDWASQRLIVRSTAKPARDRLFRSASSFSLGLISEGLTLGDPSGHASPSGPFDLCLGCLDVPASPASLSPLVRPAACGGYWVAAFLSGPTHRLDDLSIHKDCAPSSEKGTMIVFFLASSSCAGYVYDMPPSRRFNGKVCAT